MAEKYIFMCIAAKPHNQESSVSKTRIFVMEIPSGRLYNGLLSTETVKKLQLRDSISYDLSEMNPITNYKWVFEHKNFDVQPEELFKKRSVSFADLV
jgi:hypothetical protein